VCERPRVAEVHAHRHELINAFAAIEGAATLLEQETSEAERTQLHAMLVSEIGHLRDLLGPGCPHG
jgi:nitrogen-specific signal transduction histidine kinase